MLFGEFFPRIILEKLLKSYQSLNSSVYFLTMRFKERKVLAKNFPFFYESLFKLNFLALLVIESKFNDSNAFDDHFFVKIIRSVVGEFLQLTSLHSLLPATAYMGGVEFLLARVRNLSYVSNLSATSFSHLVIHVVLGYVNLVDKLGALSIEKNKTSFFSSIACKKFSDLRLRLLFGIPDCNLVVGAGHQISFRNFFSNYAKTYDKLRLYRQKHKRKHGRKFVKYFRRRAIKKTYFKFITRFKKKRKPVVVGAPRVRAFMRAWTRVFSLFKTSFLQKQFSFISFWSFNFFNLLRTPARATTRRLFYRTLRLIYFFRRFFSFFKFYGIYFRLLRTTMLADP